MLLASKGLKTLPCPSTCPIDRIKAHLPTPHHTQDHHTSPQPCGDERYAAIFLPNRNFYHISQSRDSGGCSFLTAEKAKASTSDFDGKKKS